MSWYVLYTNPRWERKVVERLQKMGMEVFCPVYTEIRQWSDRTKKVTAPLFKSYVFIRIPEKSRHQVFEVPGVVRYMYWLGKPAVVRDAEIQCIKDWLNKDEVDTIEVAHLSPGDKVTISNGSFKNHEAIVREVGNKKMRLILPELGCTVVISSRDVV